MRRYRERGSEKRERAEVVGEAEADSTLNLCKTDRKALIREMESCCRGGRRDMRREKYVVSVDEKLASEEQNKELIKDKRAAHW